MSTGVLINCCIIDILFRYVPVLNETQLDPNDVSFEPDIKRATIFTRMTFYFLNEKQVQLNFMIQMYKTLCSIKQR